MIERIEINLLPAEYRVVHKNFKLQRELVYPLLGLVIILLALALVTVSQQNEIRVYNNQITALQMQIQQNRPIQNEINRLSKDKRETEEKIRGLERISVDRAKWVEIMEVFASRLPDFTWITQIKEEASTPPVLHVEGRTLSFPEVASFMTRLMESEYITDVDLTDIEQVDKDKSNSQRTYKFQISCKLNPDVRMSNPGAN